LLQNLCSGAVEQVYLMPIKPNRFSTLYYYKTTLKNRIMKIKISGGLLIAALAITSMAQAQTRTPVINQRQHNQERRINQGVRSGELTHNEAHHLRADERRIAMTKHMDKASGRVTPSERRQLRHEENRTSRAIYRDKHNDRIRS
jgi:hypothetical protein